MLAAAAMCLLGACDELTSLQFGDVVPALDTLDTQEAPPEQPDTLAAPPEDTVPAPPEEQDTVAAAPPQEQDTVAAPPAELDTSAPPDACTQRHTILGSVCAPPADARYLNGSVSYEARTANAAMNDWGDPFVGALSSVLVAAYRWDAASQTHVLFDVAQSDANGHYALGLPAEAQPEDLVLVWLASLDADGAITVAAANPSFGNDGTRNVSDILAQRDASQLWSFAWPAQEAVAAPDLVIGEEAGSGVARVFDHMRYVYNAALSIYGRPGDSLVAWLEPGVTWECGACSARSTTYVGEHAFAANIWIGYDEDRAFWSDAVIEHELGHWVMSAYGTSPREGGRHVFGRPTLPGQAWSEGFATFFSSLARGNEFYFDKQSGTFFWFDIYEMAYPARDMLLPTADGEGHPYADDPLLQLVDENVVAAMGYAIAIGLGLDASRRPRLEDEGRFFLEALAGPRMNVKRSDADAEFPRRYVRHTWQLDDDNHIVDITPVWTASAPMFADYLDALRCLAHERGGDVDAAVAEGILSYPYPTDAAPICD